MQIGTPHQGTKTHWSYLTALLSYSPLQLKGGLTFIGCRLAPDNFINPTGFWNGQKIALISSSCAHLKSIHPWVFL